MTKKKKSSLLPKVEILIILVFFFSFIIWAVSQCSAKKVFYQTQETASREEAVAAEQDTVPLATATPAETLPTATSNNTTLTTSNVPVRIVQERYTPLYVSIEGLNLRTGPHLDSSIIVKLGLFEEVLFLNEVSDSTQIINMGEEMANEPWIKVQEKKGNVGWVYGAGLNYYKRQRSGF